MADDVLVVLGRRHERRGRCIRMLVKSLAVFTFICGVMAFGMSFHNIDLAFNAMHGTIDTNALGYVQSIPTMYLNGITGILISATTMIFGFSMLFFVKERSL